MLPVEFLDLPLEFLQCWLFSYEEGSDRQEWVSRQFRILDQSQSDQSHQAAKVMAEHFFDNLVVPF